MAALYGRRFVAVHIPKTGGKWVRKALTEAGHTFNRDLSDGHSPAPAINNPNWISFCFIRHPATWLASWWAYCERTGWANEDRLPESFDRTRVFDNMIWTTASIDHTHGFERWVCDLEGHYPGFVYKFFKPYMDSVHHVGRQETLREDLMRFVGKVPNVVPVNVGGNVPGVSDELLAYIEDREPLAKLGYESVLTGRDSGLLTRTQKGESDSR